MPKRKKAFYKPQKHKTLNQKKKHITTQTKNKKQLILKKNYTNGERLRTEPKQNIEYPKSNQSS